MGSAGDEEPEGSSHLQCQPQGSGTGMSWTLQYPGCASDLSQTAQERHFSVRPCFLPGCDLMGNPSENSTLNIPAFPCSPGNFFSSCCCSSSSAGSSGNLWSTDTELAAEMPLPERTLLPRKQELGVLNRSQATQIIYDLMIRSN